MKTLLLAAFAGFGLLLAGCCSKGKSCCSTSCSDDKAACATACSDKKSDKAACCATTDAAKADAKK